MTSPQRSLHPASGNDRGSFLGAVSGADYAAAEDRAKAERIVLWVDAQPTAPWDWRKK